MEERTMIQLGLEQGWNHQKSTKGPGSNNGEMSLSPVTVLHLSLPRFGPGQDGAQGLRRLIAKRLTEWLDDSAQAFFASIVDGDPPCWQT